MRGLAFRKRLFTKEVKGERNVSDNYYAVVSCIYNYQLRP